ncbi:hypothetical protein CRECT_1760 [Campylobacter rectus]|uniref:Uncharacterized protein n=2 Tax=Campylobacter rectus TaxID=203 RepID=A0A6G5QNT9_CAMRE|nr:hypothetical protein CRECT_1760 [Campylobacter rectus]
MDLFLHRLLLRRALTGGKFTPNLILMIFKSTITSRSFYCFQAGKFGVFIFRYAKAKRFFGVLKR